MMNALLFHNLVMMNALFQYKSQKFHNMMGQHQYIMMFQGHKQCHPHHFHHQCQHHKDAVLDFIETAIINVFQMLFQILYLQAAHQVLSVMDTEIVSLQLVQSHAHQDLQKVMEAAFQLILLILQQL